MARSSRGGRGPTREEQRQQQRSERRARKQKRIWAIGAVTILVVVGAILAVTLTGGETPGERIRLLGSSHIADGASHTPYNSVPATSGPHYFSPARWDVYTDPLQDEVLVHNLEHGGIGLHYNCPDGCDEIVGNFTTLADRYDHIIVSPYFNINTRIALTAWGYLDKFEDYDEVRILDFINSHIDEGPESVQ